MGTGWVFEGQVLSFLSTEPIPAVFDSWEPVEKREPVSGGLSSSFFRSRFPLSARLHSTFCLPFLRRLSRLQRPVGPLQSHDFLAVI